MILVTIIITSYLSFKISRFTQYMYRMKTTSNKLIINIL